MVTVQDRQAGPDLVRIYLDTISRFPLLDRSDEQRLGEAIEAGRRAARELAGMGMGRADSRRRRALRAAVAAGQRAERLFVESNLRLVVSIAKRHQRSSVPLLDLIQEGNLGLVQAVRRFDHTKGFKFSTYATWWIRQAVSRAVATRSRIIRLPLGAGRNVGLVGEARTRLGSTGSALATRRWLSAQTGLSPEEVEEALGYTGDAVSLSADGELALGDTVGDRRAAAAFDEIDRALLPSAIRRLLDVLDDRERQVVQLRFGLGEPRPHTLDEVSRRFHVSKERVRQIENRAIDKLAYPALRAELGPDVLPG